MNAGLDAAFSEELLQFIAAAHAALPGVADLTPQRLHDPYVRFFAERNPGHSDGNELCCLAPLTRANFTAAAYRVIGPAPVAPEVMV